MAPRKKVSLLSVLSLESFENLVTTIAEDLLNASSSSNPSSDLEALKTLLETDVPSCWHDDIAKHLLRSLKKFCEAHVVSDSPESLSDCRAVVEKLASIIPCLRVKKLDFGQWTEPIQSALSQILRKTTSLETLICNACLKNPDGDVTQEGYKLDEQELLDSCPSFVNLTRFVYHNHCTDEIINAICQNCKSISVIEVCGAKNVTDGCIGNLANCRELQTVDLSSTSVTVNGRSELLVKSVSQNLIEITGLIIYNENLNQMKAHCSSPFRTFQLRKVVSLLFNSDKLKLACKFLPNLAEVNINFVDFIKFDFSSLLTLENLQKLELHGLSDINLNSSLSTLLSARGSQITSLSLQFTQGSVGKIVYDIAASCPNIEHLMLRADNFGDESIKPPIADNESKPFQKLKHFVCISHSVSLPCLNFILGNAVNINEISLCSCHLLKDEFLQDLLTLNPLKKLNCLEMCNCGGNEVSDKLLNHIVLSCDGITSLKGFVNSTESARKSLQDFILVNNYDVTLS